MSSMAVTIFDGILIDGGCVPGPVPVLLFPDYGVGPDVIEGYYPFSVTLEIWLFTITLLLG